MRTIFLNLVFLILTGCSAVPSSVPIASPTVTNHIHLDFKELQKTLDENFHAHLKKQRLQHGQEEQMLNQMFTNALEKLKRAHVEAEEKSKIQYETLAKSLYFLLQDHKKMKSLEH